MEKWQVVSLLVAGLLLLVFSIYIRGHYGERFEIRTIDLVLMLLPLLFVLLVTGKIKVLDAFGIKADLSQMVTIQLIFLQKVLDRVFVQILRSSAVRDALP